MNVRIKLMTEGIPSLGSYTGVIAEIERLVKDPESTLADLGEIIEKDPDLAARLLKLGNSAFYGFAQRLETVSEAISLIGIQQVEDLLIASNVIEVFEGISATHVNMESFWHHSLACGICARCIAIARQLPGVEKFFVAGLIHDLGRLVLLSQVPQKATEIFTVYEGRRVLLREAEQEVLGFDHAAIGEQLLRGWQYPPNLVQAVAHHHQPMLAGIFQLESSVVHVADYLVHAMQMGNSGEQYVPPLSLRAWERVGLSLDLVESIMRSIDEQIEAVHESFVRSQLRSRRHL
jgi:HD-like signal output (HDOD) protein